MEIQIYQPLAIHELGQRANQEDNVFPAEGKATEQDRLFILCDGMGGHEHGEVASQCICKSLSAYLLQHTSEERGASDETFSNALKYAYGELDELAVAGDTRQMGTTLTLLWFHDKGCTAAHIGDSRIYHLRPASHTLLYKSRDHSLAYDLYQAGELSYEEMKTFPQKNVITRAMIAGDRNHPKPDVVHITDVQPGDYFYICSDGMLEQMEDEELLDIFSADISDEEKRNLLISATVGNKDNHSAYMVHIKEVSHDETDMSLGNEEPSAKCNALNIKPDVVEMDTTPDVEIVKLTGTPPPVPESVVIATMETQKKKKCLFIAFMVVIVLAVVGMGGYSYVAYRKAKSEVELLDSLRRDSLREQNRRVPRTPMPTKEFRKIEKDTTKKDSANHERHK